VGLEGPISPPFISPELHSAFAGICALRGGPSNRVPFRGFLKEFRQSVRLKFRIRALFVFSGSCGYIPLLWGSDLFDPCFRVFG